MKKLKKLIAAALALLMLCALLPAGALADGTEYAVTVNQITNGKITTPNADAAAGTQVKLTIIPDEGYRFVENSLTVYRTGYPSQAVGTEISAAGDGVYWAVFTMPDFAVSVSAEFDIVKCRVNFASSLLENGTITARVGSSSAVTIGEGSPYVEAGSGETVTITAKPDTGYQLTGGRLTASSGTLSPSGAAYTLRMPANSVTISGSFSPAETVSVEGVDNAVVTAVCGDIEIAERASGSIAVGSDVTVSVLPASGYAVDTVTCSYSNGSDTVTETIAPAGGVYTFEMPDHPVSISATMKVSGLHVLVSTNATNVAYKIGSGQNTALTDLSEGVPAKRGDRVSLLFTVGTNDSLASYTAAYTENGVQKYLDVETALNYRAQNSVQYILSFTMPAFDVALDARFSSGKTVNFASMQNGSLTAKSAGVTLGSSTPGRASAAEYLAAGGALVELYADPDDGYILEADSLTVEYGFGDTVRTLPVTYDEVGGFYSFLIPSSASVNSVTVSAEFTRGLTATISSIATGGKAEVYVTADKTDENLLAVSSVTSDVTSGTVLKRGDKVYVYVTPDQGCSLDDISVSYTLSGRDYTMTTSGTTAATKLTRDTEYSAGGAARFYFTMPAANVTVNVFFNTPLIITAVKRISDTEAEVTFISDTSGTYYYVQTIYSSRYYSTGAALKTASTGSGAATAAGTSSTPVTNKLTLKDLPNSVCYVHLVVADRLGAYTNIVRAEIPMMSHGTISSGNSTYSLAYELSGTALTLKGITGEDGADVTNEVAAAFAERSSGVIINLSDCGTLTRIDIPYSMIAPFSAEINEYAAVPSLEVDFNGNNYGFIFDADAIVELADPLSAASRYSYVVLGLTSGTYSSLTAAQKTFIDEYTGARVLIPTVAYMNYDSAVPAGSVYPDFDGSARFLAVHAIDKSLTPLGVAGYEIARDNGSIRQAKYSYTPLADGNGYIDFTLRSVPAKLVIGYWTNPFSDIETWPQNSAFDWAYEAVKYNEIDGRFKGMEDGTFSPYTNMNTAQLVTVLYRVRYGVDPDQSQGAYWYTTAATWAMTNGIVNVETFDAAAPVTREQFVTMFYDTLRLTDKTVAATAAMRTKLATAVDYADISASSRDAVAWAVHSGLISGTTANVLTIDPTGNINRIQVCQMLRNYYTKVLA